MKKYRFWIKSSRGFSAEKVVEMAGDEDVQDHLEEWCNTVYPMFHTTSATLKYGYEEIDQKEKQ